MSPTNPYSPPTSNSQSQRLPRESPGYYTAGAVAGALMGCLYVVVLGAAIYEYLGSKPPLLTTDYVRTATTSCVFAGLSFSASALCLRRSPAAVWFLILSPLLLIVFVFPGLNAVWNFAERLFSL